MTAPSRSTRPITSAMRSFCNLLDTPREESVEPRGDAVMLERDGKVICEADIEGVIDEFEIEEMDASSGGGWREGCCGDCD